MKSKDVHIGLVYLAKVSGDLVPVLLNRASPYGGWDARNQITGRAVRIKTAARLRREVKRCIRCERWDFEAYIRDGVCAYCRPVTSEELARWNAAKVIEAAAKA